MNQSKTQSELQKYFYPLENIVLLTKLIFLCNNVIIAIGMSLEL